MRHRKRGRRLGRSSSHRKALLRNLASSLILTERDAEHDGNAPKVKGRIVTTMPKAKEVRPLVEKCITIARNSLPHAEEARQYATSAERGSEDWRQWRRSERWQQWCAARAPVVTARRRAMQLLGSKQAVQVLFEEIAPRFAERNGGYTRILQLAEYRLGDAGTKAILELVGRHERKVQKSQRPSFKTDEGPGKPDEEPVKPDAAADLDELDSGDELQVAGDAAPAAEEESKS